MPDVFIVVSDTLDITLVDKRGITPPPNIPITSLYNESPYNATFFDGKFVPDPEAFQYIVASDTLAVGTVELPTTSNPAYTQWGGEDRDWDQVSETWNESLRVYENRTEDLDVSLLETLLINNNLTSTDDLNISLTELSAYLIILALTTTDSVDISLIESSSAVNILLNKLASDNLDINLSEASLIDIIKLVISASDEVGISLNDSYDSILSKLNRVDTLTITLSELREIFYSLGSSDTINIRTSEGRTIYNMFTKSDTLDVSLTDDTEPMRNIFTALDTIDVSLTYVKSIFGRLRTREWLDITVSDDATPIAVFLDRVDNLSVQISEIRNLLVALQRNDDIDVTLTESGLALLIFLLVNANDTLSIEALDNSETIQAFLNRMDSANVSLSEVNNILSSLLRNDNLNIELLDTYSYPGFASLMRKMPGYEVKMERVSTHTAIIQKVLYDVTIEKLETKGLVSGSINNFDVTVKRIR